MKNLANCTPTEFLKQTVKIKKSVEKWLKVTDIMNIRKQMPKLPEINKEDSEEDRMRTILKRKEIIKEQSMKNLSQMFDKAFEEHPEETLELIALCCFTEPDHIDDHPMTYYMSSIYEMIQTEEVQSFFGLLMQWGQKGTSVVSKT